MLFMATPTAQLKLAAQIKKIRQKKGLSQEEMSRRTGIHLRNYQRMESQSPRAMRVDTLDRIAKALNVPLKKFFDF